MGEHPSRRRLACNKLVDVIQSSTNGFSVFLVADLCLHLANAERVEADVTDEFFACLAASVDLVQAPKLLNGLMARRATHPLAQHAPS